MQVHSAKQPASQVFDEVFKFNRNTENVEICAAPAGEDTREHQTAAETISKIVKFSAADCFALVQLTNEIDVYNAPQREKGARWELLRSRLKEKGIDRSIESLRVKLNDLIKYHMVRLIYLSTLVTLLDTDRDCWYHEESRWSIQDNKGNDEE